MKRFKAIHLKILIINGPNLNLIGTREPDIYGSDGFDTYLAKLRNQFSTIEIDYFQSNIEGELINRLHLADSEDLKGIILNAGGYSHTSVALADAVAAIQCPVIGVHISNIYQREQERHQELLAQYIIGGIFGFGLDGYEYAIQKLINR